MRAARRLAVAGSFGDTDWRRQRLVDVVRPEFRVSTYVADVSDPLLGPPTSKQAERVRTPELVDDERACMIDGCSRGRRKSGWCDMHYKRWLRAGQPDPSEFMAAGGPMRRPPRAQRWKVGDLPDLLALEMQYVLECRHDERAGRLWLPLFNAVVRLVVSHAGTVTSVVDRSFDFWRLRLCEANPQWAARTSNMNVVFLRYAYRRLTSLYDDRDEYDKDTWDLELVGVPGGQSGRWLHFEDVPQPWLRALAKRWVRLYLPTVSAGQLVKRLQCVRSFAAYVAETAPSASSARSLDRRLIEGYLSALGSQQCSDRTRRFLVGGLRRFLDDCRLHGWADLPADARVYPSDMPKQSNGQPRFVDEFVMGQVENESNLARLADDGTRSIVAIVLRTGRRIGEVLTLPFDRWPDGAPVLDYDDAGAPYLRYQNRKMGRMHTIPIDPETEDAIRRQRELVRERFPQGSPWLFPRLQANPDGKKPFVYGTVSAHLHKWLDDCDVRDASGQRVKVTFHQFRHTIGTRMVNSDVRLDVVQEFLGHDTPEMTARYARIHDRTLKNAFEKYRLARVNYEGVPVAFLPGGVTAMPAG